MADWEMKTFDLWPPFGPVLLSDQNGPMDLSTDSEVKFIGKGQSTGGVTISGASTILQSAFTANTTNNSATLSSVSSFTNIWGPGAMPNLLGSTIIGPGIPSGTTVEAYSSGVGTITMTNQATQTGSAVALIANKGTVWYVWATGDSQKADTYKVEFERTLSTGKPQTVPNQLVNNLTLLIDQDLEGA